MRVFVYPKNANFSLYQPQLPLETFIKTLFCLLLPSLSVDHSVTLKLAGFNNQTVLVIGKIFTAQQFSNAVKNGMVNCIVLVKILNTENNRLTFSRRHR